MQGELARMHQCGIPGGLALRGTPSVVSQVCDVCGGRNRKGDLKDVFSQKQAKGAAGVEGQRLGGPKEQICCPSGLRGPERLPGLWRPRWQPLDQP